MEEAPTSSACGSHESGDDQSPRKGVRERDIHLPVANIARIMKKALPANIKITQEAKDSVQECATEFISLITNTASDKCQKEKRKTITGDDLLFAIATIGFRNYIDPLRVCLSRYRELGDAKEAARGGEKSAIPDANEREQFVLEVSSSYINAQGQLVILPSNSTQNNELGQFGDTTLTKVFVGGLAWETPIESMRDHFDQFGDILEAVIISDKITGRSKGYGFVTFKDAESATRACEDTSPIINGRRANCNLASLGARRPWSSSTPPPPQQGTNGGARSQSASAAPGNPVQWYYPAGTPPPTTFHHHNHQAVPYYGYSPTTTYIATDINYNHKVSYTGAGGAYMNGHFSGGYPGQGIMGGNTLMPMYPLYHYHQSQTMGPPSHLFQPATAGALPALPTIISKPPSLAPNPGGRWWRKLEEPNGYALVGK